MNVPVVLQLGLQGNTRSLSSMWIGATTVGHAAAWSGSYHVLRMDEHYDDYVISNRVLGFPPIPGFPAAHPYERLPAKVRAGGVTGNIGECAAALFARQYLNAPIRDIVHVKPRQRYRRRKAPDYMMRLATRMPGVFQPLLGSTVMPSFPDWWPVESKARTTAAQARFARQGALRQLVTYWTLLVRTQPAAVGFGMTATLGYQAAAELQVTLFIPSRPQALIRDLRRYGDRITNAVLWGSIYGC